MSLLKDNEFYTIEEFMEENVLKLIWKDTSEQLNFAQDEYKALILQWASTVQDKKPKGVLVDTRQHSVIIHPEMQTWFVEKVFPKYKLSGIGKLAFIACEDFISQLSVEQTMKEENELPFETQYFADEIEGFVWAST